MSAISKTAVVQAFLVDHRKFMKLLRDVGVALDEGHVDLARELGAELNRVGGPHIAFEEAVLYPSLEMGSDDRTFVRRLYGEHRLIIDALSTLLTQESLDEATLQELAERFRQGVEHAEHCGTLVSHLETLVPVDQQEALDDLQQLRGQDLLWTDFKRRP